MFYKRSGIPEIEEIVLCKVAEINPNSVFVDLVEYDCSGIVHISEIAPGRIRNLRDYVSVGRQIVCKVIRINFQNRHLDLSLRRVNSSQRMEKLEEIKQELKAETIVKNFAKKLQKREEILYKEIAAKIFKEYSHLYLCFREIANDQADLEKLGMEKKIAQELTHIIVEKFRPKKIILKGEIKLQTYVPDGVGKIKQLLLKIEKISPTISLSYLGAGRYQFKIEDIDYKPAEQHLGKMREIISQFNDKASTAVFEREKTE